MPAEPVGRGSAERVVEAAQPGAGRKGRLAGVVEGSRAGERPGLPAVLQEAEPVRGGADPAEAEHEGLDVDGSGARVSHRDVEARALAGEVRGEPELERAEPLRPGAERSLREEAALATFARDTRPVADAEADGLEATRGRVVGDDATAGHGRRV